MPAVAALLLCLAAGPDAGGGTVRTQTFRTEVSPRIDPVFGSAHALRAAVDQFLELETEMARVRSEFGTGVHRTLALVGAGKPCPPAVPLAYARAREAGQRFLSLGRRLEARFRDIRRSEELGETAGLTPDYRLKVKRTRELYATLLRDYREMKASFHDQLGAEMRHAGCRADASEKLATAPAGAPDPLNLDDWQLAPLADPERPPPGNGKSTPGKPAANDSSPTAPGIWIAIDNTRCTETSLLTLDGAIAGEIPPGKKTSVRTRAGPHELCVLPVSDGRACGAPGTVRRAYLYEGWSLAVRCGK